MLWQGIYVMKLNTWWRAFVGMTLMCFTVSTFATSHNVSGQVSNRIGASIQGFYKDPSYQNFLHITQPLSSVSQKTDVPRDTVMLLALILHAHPKFQGKLIQQMPTFKGLQRASIIAALGLVGHAQGAKQHGQVSLRGLLTPLQINRLKIVSAHDVQLTMGAYFASGQVFYLKKILGFIVADHDLLSRAGHLMRLDKRCHLASTKVGQLCQTARNKFLFSLKFKYPKNTEQKFQQVIAISSAIWAIESLSQQDKQLKSRVNNLVSEFPKLNYKNYW